jgi:NAD(P)-dependent dehydrogenase (short-subunit alcohol dehydrogenase family)
MGVLDDRAVVITGAGRGLGRSFALAAARAGAAVLVNDIDGAEANVVVAAIRAGGGTAVASDHSVAEWDAAGELIGLCVSEFGAIDGLVNNAVAYSFFGLPWEEDGDQARRAVETNVLGTLNCGIHAMRAMVPRRAGSIVNLSSRAMLGNPGSGTYGATKGATASAAFNWALELMPHAVRANALAPAAQTRGVEIAGSFSAPDKPADSPDLVAPAVVYLLSDLSAGISGQLFMMLGRRFGLIRGAAVDHVEERELWTAEEIADVVERVFRPQLQPIGVRSPGYEWAPER